MWWCSAVALAAPQVTVPTYDPSRSLAPLVEAVAPAVVTLEVESTARLPDLPPEVLGSLPFDPHRFPQTRTGEGSGFFVSADGELLTNWHVVEGASRVTVVTADGRRLDARVLGGDPALDVALLDVEGSEPWLGLGDGAGLRVGDWVLAMGNGLGLGSTATVGIVSGRGRSVSRDVLAADFLQTDAAINEGNSGGPVFSLDGSVVGMSTATVVGANTVGFAIPAARIRAVLDDLRRDGFVSRGYLGLSPGDGDGGGAMVVDVVDGAPASAAGLQVGDRILRVGGEAIDDARDLVVTVAAHRPGHEVEVAIERAGKARTVTVELGARPDPRRATTPISTQRLMDLTLRSTDPAPEPGVLVVEIASTSPLAGRLRAGDRIVAVNQRPARTASEVASALQRSSGEVTFEVVRDGARQVVVGEVP
jgi:serine protease Do